MTYLQFLAIFLVPPILVLAVAFRRRLWRGLGWQLGLVILVAVIYTGPWDGALIGNGVWTYAPGQVTGRTILAVPVEEYGFYALQTVLVGLLAAGLLRRSERVG